MISRLRITPNQIAGRAVFNRVLGRGATVSDLTLDELAQAADYFKTSMLTVPGGNAVRGRIMAEYRKRMEEEKKEQT